MNNNLNEIRQEGYMALNQKLGAVGTVIFMKQFDSGYGNYTEEREAKLNDIAIDDVVKSIKSRKNK